MGFNNFVNATLILSGILDFLGTVGGIGFIAYIVKVYVIPLLAKEESTASCRECENFEICVAVMDGELPDHPCAYYKKKKP